MAGKRKFGRTFGIFGVGALVMAGSYAVLGFNPEQDEVNSHPVPTHWQDSSVTWNLNPTAGKNILTSGGTSLQQTVQNAFNSWQKAQVSVSGQAQTVTSVNIALGQVSATLPSAPDSSDCVNVVGFADLTPSDFPTGTIAFTQISTQIPSPGQQPPFTYPCTSAAGKTTLQTCSLDSCLMDADIEFNTGICFSTTTPVSTAICPVNSMTGGYFDLQSIATHEIGHMLGLDHSGLANAVMYPYGDSGLSQQKALSSDDVAGIGFLYPAANFSSVTGSISGKVTLSGAGIFAAHVVAIDTATGSPAVDGLSNPDGTYKLVGVPPGSYNVLVLPLEGPYDLTNFSGWTCGYDEAQNAPPCCDPTLGSCAPASKSVVQATNYTGGFY